VHETRFHSDPIWVPSSRSLLRELCPLFVRFSGATTTLFVPSTASSVLVRFVVVQRVRDPTAGNPQSRIEEHREAHTLDVCLAILLIWRS
jgi:hypothetical protein